MTDYFHNFAPADAVQYDGDPRTFAAWALVHLPDSRVIASSLSHVSIIGGLDAPLQLDTGQWLVYQGGESWVQDEEPARVERWETRTRPLEDAERCEFTMKEGGARCPMERGHYGGVHNYIQHMRKVSHRRPVLSNGWTGPWMPVEGGAE